MKPTPENEPPAPLEFGPTLSGGPLESGQLYARIEIFGKLFDALPSPPEGPALIYQVEGKNEVHFVLLGEEEIIVGRDPKSAQLAFPESQKLSRAHFRIRQIEGFYVMKDLDSKNGTFLNSSTERIKEHWLNAGDIILAGDLIFAFTGD